MTEHTHPPTKVLVVIGIIIVFWLLVSLILLSAVGIKDGWPAFLALPLFMLTGGTDVKQLSSIFVGAVTGLIMAAAIAPVVTFLVKSGGMPQEFAILLVLGLLVFLIVALGGMAPMFFNNYNFVYFSVALIYPVQQTVPWLGTLILGGVFFIGSVLLSMKFIIPRLIKDSTKPTISA